MSSWHRLGASWCHLKPFGGLLGPSWRHLGALVSFQPSMFTRAGLGGGSRVANNFGADGSSSDVLVANMRGLYQGS